MFQRNGDRENEIHVVGCSVLLSTPFATHHIPFHISSYFMYYLLFNKANKMKTSPGLTRVRQEQQSIPARTQLILFYAFVIQMMNPQSFHYTCVFFIIHLVSLLLPLSTCLTPTSLRLVSSSHRLFTRSLVLLFISNSSRCAWLRFCILCLIQNHNR